ncbi:MAG TPA: aspartate aminotransferase family protein [Thermomicrobiaceae bacterium]|nr:aspartate aminotransferase family protein [Thermomicrobiaceae bacterium]
MSQATGAALVQRDKELQPPLYAKRDIALVRGEGVTLWDSDGRAYLDMMSNYGVNILGHAHPRVTAAIQQQAATLLNCHQSFASDVRVAFLEKLLSVAPEGLTQAFLSNSGTEAVEAALKFAWVATGRTRVVAARRGYHGRTIGALAATAEKKYRDPFAGVLAEAAHVPYGDADALFEAVDGQTAAVVLEPIQGEGGVHVPPPGYLAEVRQIAHDAGALLVFDEIQTGFRTGTWFACGHEGVAPDLMALSKGLANGVPVGATLMTEAIAGTLEGGVHGTTFGGNPLAAAAGLATLETLDGDGVLGHSAEVGDYLTGRLRELEHPKVREVRGRGLMIGVELKQRATGVLRGLQERGVLGLMAGPLTIRFLPPLIITRDDADRAVAALVAALG